MDEYDDAVTVIIFDNFPRDQVQVFLIDGHSPAAASKDYL